MKILLIEDDTVLATALCYGLKKQGYVVDMVSDGQQAKKRFHMYRDAYDLVILDLVLPDISGVEICKIARSLHIKTPILVLTGKTSVEDKVEALNSGADDYLTKPFSTEELIARIKALLRRPRALLPKVLVVAGIALDMNRRLATKDGKDIALSLKEFGVLEYLMHRPNQVVQRDEILDHVWDYQYTSLSNIVDVHINHLRTKLDLKKGNILETVRGVGYRLKV